MTTEPRNGNGFLREAGKLMVAVVVGYLSSGWIDARSTARDVDRIEKSITQLQSDVKAIAERQSAAIATREERMKALSDRIEKVEQKR